MIATLTNSETGKKITLQYMATGLDAGGFDAQYAADGVPGTAKNTYYWQGTTEAARSLSFILDGAGISDVVGELESWGKPGSGKTSPPPIVLSLGQLAPKSLYLTKVATTYPLPFFRDGLPTRASIAINFLPI